MRNKREADQSLQRYLQFRERASGQPLFVFEGIQVCLTFLLNLIKTHFFKNLCLL